VKLVSEATALGVTHTSLGRSKMDWDALLQQVYKRYAYIAQLPLSMFGRAFAASGYDLAKILYAAEDAGLPPEPALLGKPQRHWLTGGWPLVHQGGSLQG
jgi:hypothetical protein